MTDPQGAASFCEQTLSNCLITNLLHWVKVGFLRAYTERGNLPALSFWIGEPFILPKPFLELNKQYRILGYHKKGLLL